MKEEEEEEDGKKERKKRMTEKKDQQGMERRERILDCQALHLRRVYTPWAPWPSPLLRCNTPRKQHRLNG